MKIILDEKEIDLVNNIANRYDVNSDKLWEMYQQIMKCNFEQDLCDTARENEEEL